MDLVDFGWWSDIFKDGWMNEWMDGRCKQGLGVDVDGGFKFVNGVGLQGCSSMVVFFKYAHAWWSLWMSSIKSNQLLHSSLSSRSCLICLRRQFFPSCAFALVTCVLQPRMAVR
jgi:hypothetical protein